VRGSYTGVISAKYHKSHEWPGLRKAYDEPLSPSRVTFKSSFGVEFGLFICFDIMFEDPPKVAEG
jgi:predicted amidohydrolase